MSRDFDRLQRSISYQFKDSSLLIRAVTHRSANENHNERLEFLGDSILDLVIAEELYNQFTDAKEGVLSRMRANLVNREVLADIAIELDLGPHLQLGAGERKSGGKRRISILANAVEALIGAVYLDNGLEQSRTLIRSLFKHRLQVTAIADQLKDSKSLLQELLQSKGLALPNYTVSEISGDAHNQTFIVECRVKLLSQVVTGKGKSKQLAEQDAAQQILVELGN